MRVLGGINFLLVFAVIGAILMSAAIDIGRVTLLGSEIEIANAFRDIIMVAVTCFSLALTPKAIRVENGFSWGPMKEVAKLFAGIFIAIISVLAMLRAGEDGAFAPLLALVSNPDGSPNNVAYFWLAGALSSFLDNAPTYLVFFELAGGDR